MALTQHEIKKFFTIKRFTIAGLSGLAVYYGFGFLFETSAIPIREFISGVVGFAFGVIID